MPEKQLPAEEILRLLSEQPQQIGEHAKGAPIADLHAPPQPGEWSANEVLAHLRACADMWGKAIEQILSADQPTIRATNPRTWIHQTNYLELDFAKSFRAFIKQRKALVVLLEGLSPNEWSRSASITGAGKPLQRTVHFYAQWLATHERPHVKQIAKVIEAARATG